MQIFLETDRLLLRRFTDADAGNLFDLDSDPEVMRFVGGEPTGLDAIERDILPAYLAYYERGDRYGFWAAVEKSSGDFLGWFHFRPLPGASPDEPELGYRLRAAAWSKGYATEGSRALIRKGFSELGVTRVVASTSSDNLASRRVLEKTGLRFVRTFFHTSPDVEAVEYALNKADWENMYSRR